MALKKKSPVQSNILPFFGIKTACLFPSPRCRSTTELHRNNDRIHQGAARVLILIASPNLGDDSCLYHCCTLPAAIALRAGFAP